MQQRPLSSEPTQLNRLDEEFKRIIRDIERHSYRLNPQERARVDQWCKKLCQGSVNTTWRQNRNIQALMLLDCVLENELKEPFVNLPSQNYLDSTSKSRMRRKITALKEELNRDERVNTRGYHSPVKTVSFNKTSSSGRPPTNLKRDIRNTRMLRETTGSDWNQTHNVTFGTFETQASRSPSARKRTSLETKNSEMKMRQTTQSSGHNRFGSFGVRVREDSANTREMRIKQAQVDVAKSTIVTLKEELNDRLRTISQLNRNFERLNEEEKKAEYERNLIEEFLGKLKDSIKQERIYFRDTDLNDDLLREVNILYGIFTPNQFKVRQRAAGYPMATQESVNVSFGKTENSPYNTQQNEDAALSDYYEKLKRNSRYSNQENLKPQIPKETKRLRFSMNF